MKNTGATVVKSISIYGTQEKAVWMKNTLREVARAAMRELKAT